MNDVDFMYELLSKKDCIVEYASHWEEWYNRALKCSVCGWPAPEKELKPVGVDVVVKSQPKGAIAYADVFPKLLDEYLYKLVEPYCRHQLIGACYVQERKGGKLTETPYVTIHTPYQHTIDAHRGQYCRHRRCKGCGVIANAVFWASGAVVRRDLDDRRVCQDALGRVYIDPRVADKLKLTKEFPDLRLYKVDVVDEPLDGDTLPGDPGWTGRLKERRFPAPPKKGPPKGRWTV